MQGTADSPPEQRKLLAEYRRQVEANPADAETWELIGEIAAGTEDLGLAKQAFEKLITLRPGDLVAHKRLAELYEWSNDPGRAFDIYAKLAEQKDDAALDRLIALNPGLYRDKDVLRLLRAAVGEANGDKYLLSLAQLLTEHGQYAEADAMYEKHLKGMPTDAAVMAEYAQALKRQHAYGRALFIWKELQELRPDDEGIRGEIAETYYLLGDFTKSLQAYQQLAKRSTHLDTILKYCTLAESLGDFQRLSEALRREMELKAHVWPEDFIKLAYVSRLLGTDAECQEVLERGLARFPGSDAVRIQLALFFVEIHEPRRALPILAQNPGLKTNLVAVQIYLSLLLDQREEAVAEKFLKTGIDEKILATQSISMLRALLYQRVHDNVAAERVCEKLYNDFPEDNAFALEYVNVLMKLGKTKKAESVLKPLLKDPTPAVLRQAVSFHAEQGNHKEAERLQTRLMAMAGNAAVQDWSYLGDIRYSAGKRSSAQHAYRRALALTENNPGLQPQ